LLVAARLVQEMVELDLGVVVVVVVFCKALEILLLELSRLLLELEERHQCLQLQGKVILDLALHLMVEQPGVVLEVAIL
jgi:hypothetical protein